ncbi:hypothetical protein V8B97DRAFT_1918928 [Scleroderma yunnanense]
MAPSRSAVVLSPSPLTLSPIALPNSADTSTPVPIDIDLTMLGNSSQDNTSHTDMVHTFQDTAVMDQANTVIGVYALDESRKPIHSATSTQFQTVPSLEGLQGYTLAWLFTNCNRIDEIQVAHVQAVTGYGQTGKGGEEELVDIANELHFRPLFKDKLQHLKNKVAKFADMFALSVQEVKPINLIKLQLNILKDTTFLLKVHQQSLTQAQKEFYLSMLDKFKVSGISWLIWSDEVKAVHPMILTQKAHGAPSLIMDEI